MTNDSDGKSGKKTAKKTVKKTPAAQAAPTPAARVTRKESPLRRAITRLKDELKTTDWHVSLDPKSARQSQPYLPTGSVIIDYLIGGKPNDHGVAPCPGLPKSRIINLYGHEGSGKTTIALTAAATTIRNGGTVGYIDWEHEIVPAYAMALGVPIGDPDKFALCQPDTLDDGIAILWTMASAGVDLIVLDSVGAGVPKAFFNKKIAETADQGRVGMNAAVWSAFLPKLKARLSKTHTTIIGISQIREAIKTGGPPGGHGDTTTVQGGKAWKFYSAVRMKLARVHTEKASTYSSVTNKTEERVVGAQIKAKLDKCKVSDQQGNDALFYIRWGHGVDDLRSFIEIALAHKIARKNGSSYSWVDPDGTEHKGAGMEKFRQLFVNDAKKAKVLEKQVRPFMLSKSESSSDDEEEGDEAEPHGEDPFAAHDAELDDILSSISGETAPVETESEEGQDD